MKILVFALLMTAIGSSPGCRKQKHGLHDLPVCIQQKIAAIKAQPKWNPPAKVWRSKYEGKTVYYFSANCCDQYSLLVDADCNYICAPDGGITGMGDGRCPSYHLIETPTDLVWEDDR